MISPQVTDDAVQVALKSCGAHAELALGHLTRHFGVTPEVIAPVLARGHGVIAPAVSRKVAQAALPVLAALGLQVTLRPTGAAPMVERFDLSIRLRKPDAIHAARKTLKQLGWLAETAHLDFRGPAGLEITGLPQPRAEGYFAALRALPGVGVTMSAQSSASYDLFAPAGIPVEDMSRLLRHVSVLACSAMDHCPPIAVDLDLGMMTHLLERFPGLGLIGVNQAFQRYNLTMTGQGRISRQEMMDFLASRGCNVERDDGLGQGMRLETGLSRPAAKQFIADYAAIGMTVRADLIIS